MALSLSSYKKSIISAEKLLKILDSRKIKILDCRWYLGKPEKGLLDFKTSHLPKSIFFDIEKLSDLKNPNPHMLPNLEDFNYFISINNIRKTDLVIFYDQNGFFSSARVWFTFKYFQFKNLSILDGGLSNWMKKKYPVTSKIKKTFPSINKSKFISNYVASKKQIKQKLINGKDTIIIDARPKNRFSGISPEPRKDISSGHIQGSINVPFSEITKKNGKLKSIYELKTLFSFLGNKTKKQEVICSCGSGITACNLIFALNILGYKNLKLYDGSWAEWGKK